MTWSAPRTWATGLVVTATILNTEIRDNLLELSTHVHDGSAGEGTDQLSGVDSITHDDIADPAAPGASKTVLWSNSGKLHQRAGAAGVAEELSVTTHNHAVTETGQTETIPDSWPGSSVGLSTTYSNPTTATRVVGGTGTRAVVVAASALIAANANTGGDSGTVSMEVRVDAVQKKVHTTATLASTTGLYINAHTVWTEASMSAASHDFDCRFKRNNTIGTISASLLTDSGSPANGDYAVGVTAVEIED